jgi:hypothetical protein
MNMNKIINTLQISTSNFIQGRKGTYRAIAKCPSGFYTVSTLKTDYEGFKPSDILSFFKKGGLATVEFKADESTYDTWLTVFAMKGKKCVIIDEDIMAGLTVGAINQYWIDTNLYSQLQYSVVNANNWTCKAFVMNAA